MNDTICAISTPYGVGGIAVVRISGSNALAFVEAIFQGKCTLSEAKAGSVLYGNLMRNDEVLDEVLVSVFRAPHSFTGEDVVEVSCHGSLFVQQEVLRWLVAEGCRMAAPGEFTQRAFLNGKLDLAEAEAVADLIASESKAAHDIAIRQMRGGVSSELQALRGRLLDFTSLVELELDFADHEDLEFADRTALRQLADEIERHIRRLLSTFQWGNALRNGIPVAIIGPTNAGKSTLLNLLVGEERAIVSNIHGTTRDMIEDTVTIEGVQFRFIDTAGIRRTDDSIEELGIQRSLEAAKKATIILMVQDAAAPQELYLPSDCVQGKKVLRLFNKSDLLLTVPNQVEKDTLYIAAGKGDMGQLRQWLLEQVPQTDRQGAVISNLRHYEALQQALDAILRVQQGMEAAISGEFLSMDLQDCLSALGQITGEITSQDTLNNIFSRFCIGK
ncbi:MAG: tRNA uridine-5-carboxymethylaminomethyl(34) synthesis GTPase MnmE [Paludibacter sp.]|nr:tRNA uridine-5-carboxymethylaminomethyl(34) synthesis GTPase MnmE [Bacteroidales bacterium]MCM1069966.1 tRNA uridine-5-carboxymethylaminomethyl(34) synthesis GTPase MnmE [Prevotella sp.]MCM1354548.1 tRNA uridine-5-carboxymethylaminomethyl(34) synthesis GTPase MnmE [Bacteroides sp.]MCM1443559.1 tRNA uridine-5-carboxymethylaminomethyl(34) synthesis GTPase MnmE [Muribaculum sp.]MCM1482631.1 tRNA uridine-5-carboxymethylaminomethyl(34) synthesis GTPase MnmE [Paludibacter sp.]